MWFDLSIPTRIHFGAGVLEKALNEEKDILRGSVLIITTPSLQKLGVIERVVGVLKGIPKTTAVQVFSSITPNPKVDEVNQAIQVAIESKADVIVGIGGGSALDAAKAVAAGAGSKEPIDRFIFGGEEPGEGTLPVIAIPTTAGTGSELSKSGIISCPEKRIKTGVRGRRLYPVAAIVDPELTYTLPRSITMETGFDVLAHAIESYISRASNWFTDSLAEQAIIIASKSLIELADNMSDYRARQQMSYASMIMGINLGNASTVLPHRMQYPIGALTDSSHGKGLAALYPAWIEMTYPYSSERFNRIGQLLSGQSCRSSKDVLGIFIAFLKRTCGVIRLKDFGLTVQDSTLLTSMVTGNIALDPAGEVSGIVEKIYTKALLAE